MRAAFRVDCRDGQSRVRGDGNDRSTRGGGTTGGEDGGTDTPMPGRGDAVTTERWHLDHLQVLDRIRGRGHGSQRTDPAAVPRSSTTAPDSWTPPRATSASAALSTADDRTSRPATGARTGSSTRGDQQRNLAASLRERHAYRRRQCPTALRPQRSRQASRVDGSRRRSILPARPRRRDHRQRNGVVDAITASWRPAPLGRMGRRPLRPVTRSATATATGSATSSSGGPTVMRGVGRRVHAKVVQPRAARGRATSPPPKKKCKKRKHRAAAAKKCKKRK